MTGNELLLTWCGMCNKSLVLLKLWFNIHDCMLHCLFIEHVIEWMLGHKWWWQFGLISGGTFAHQPD